ncbi:uncharacterized protein EI90DRAFT_258172 [Cantharellus anzutake]|uniref:uncharacterized protein n=1 Tax=Cantharellus anzutake TaxID=1750568 RepID=UPI001906F771|nr:uncharacterized protein EI90DRAFT_258172 [Cantharellus anzutake]KAF8335788.1 hypothetical protein EI90DRAFT_258172 [Cantharellus anzutake]
MEAEEACLGPRLSYTFPSKGRSVLGPIDCTYPRECMCYFWTLPIRHWGEAWDWPIHREYFPLQLLVITVNPRLIFSTNDGMRSMCAILGDVSLHSSTLDPRRSSTQASISASQLLLGILASALGWMMLGVEIQQHRWRAWMTDRRHVGYA